MPDKQKLEDSTKTSYWDDFKKAIEKRSDFEPRCIVFPEGIFDEGVRRGIIKKSGKDYCWEGLKAYRDHRMPTGMDLGKFKLSIGYRNAKTG